MDDRHTAVEFFRVRVSKRVSVHVPSSTLQEETIDVYTFRGSFLNVFSIKRVLIMDDEVVSQRVYWELVLSRIVLERWREDGEKEEI